MTYSKKSNSKSKNNNDQWRNFSFSSSSLLVSRIDKKTYGNDTSVYACLPYKQIHAYTHTYERFLFCWNSWRCARLRQQTAEKRELKFYSEFIVLYRIRVKLITDQRKYIYTQTYNHIEIFRSIWLWVFEYMHMAREIHSSDIYAVVHMNIQRFVSVTHEMRYSILLNVNICKMKKYYFSPAYLCVLFSSLFNVCIWILFVGSALLHWRNENTTKTSNAVAIAYIAHLNVYIIWLFNRRGLTSLFNLVCGRERARVTEQEREWHCCVIQTHAHSEYDSWQWHYLTHRLRHCVCLFHLIALYCMLALFYI